MATKVNIIIDPSSDASDVYVRNYKSYMAILNQTGLGAPVPTIIENTIGDIVWSRYDAGIYKATLAGAFPVGKTVFPVVNNTSRTFYIVTKTIDFAPDELGLEIYTMDDTTIDGVIDNQLIEIRVYN